MRLLIQTGLASVLLAVGAAPQLGAVTHKTHAVQKALAAGLSPAGAGQQSPWSPFVRLIRQGSHRPIDVQACARVVALSGAGQLKTLPSGRPFFANPHPYIGLQMKLASGYEEYVEAGLGYDGSQGGFFRPYIRRAPDTYDAGGPPAPADFEPMHRNGAPLPGYWAAKRDDLSKLMAVDGEICMDFGFDEGTQLYRFQYTIRNPALGTAVWSKTLYMASARLKMNPSDSGTRIQDFQARLLTSIATTGENFDPQDPLFENSVFAVHWRASARDRALSSAYEPYSQRNFSIANYDPNGDMIYYRLDPL